MTLSIPGQAVFDRMHVALSNRWAVLLGRLLVLVLLGASTAVESAAQSEERYTFALVGIPLREALEYVLDTTPLNLAYETALVENRTTYCKVERVPAEALLACVLEGTGVDFARLSSGTYILIPHPEYISPRAQLTGVVQDAATGVPLSDAHVFIVGENIGRVTNRDGRFAFAALLPGAHRLIVTHIAYHEKADTIWVSAGEATPVRMTMRPRVVLATPVIVNGFEARIPSDELGAETPELEDAPVLGTPDVVQQVGSVVGVRLGDALSDVHVQGGASNEQHFLLDGLPIFVPIPNGGFVGPFSPFAVQQVTVRKAGFDAAHGSGLSGVIEIEQPLAKGEGPALMVQVDPLSVNARWNGEASRGNTSDAQWMVAWRKGLWDVRTPQRLEDLFRTWASPDLFLINALSSGENTLDAEVTDELVSGPLEVGFHDVHAAARLQLGGLRSVRFSAYQGSGAFGIDDVHLAEDEEAEFEDAYRWHNYAGQLRYEWVQNSRLFLNAQVWHTAYQLLHPFSLGGLEAVGLARTSVNDFNNVAESGLHVEGDWAASPRHMLSGKVATTYTGSDFALVLDPFSPESVQAASVNPIRWRMSGFIEDRVSLGTQHALKAGMRFTYLPGHRRVYMEPRLSWQYDQVSGVEGNWAVRIAGGRYRQYLQGFDVATYNVASLLPRVRFWLPVGADQRPPEAYHATASVSYRWRSPWQLTVETYYKHQPHLLVLNYARVSDNLLAKAKGYAYGVSGKVGFRGERIQASTQYEYAVAKRRVENRFEEAYVPVPWDAPHRIFASINLRVGDHWTVLSRWEGVFGRSWGFRQGYYDFLEPNPETPLFAPFDLSNPSRHTRSAFAQWDLGVAYARMVAGVGIQGRVSIMNVLGRQNVTDWSLRYDESAQQYVSQARHAASFIPSFSLRFSR